MLFQDFTSSACVTMDIKRKKSAISHSSLAWKISRKLIRANKKKKGDKTKQKEGKTYKAGEF